MRRQDVIDILRDERGYIGKKNRTDDTSVKEAPNGKGKYNKYSRELAPLNYYNGSKDGADYCAILIDWAFYKAAGNNMAEAVKYKPLYGYGKDIGWRCGAGCTYAHDAYLKDQQFDKPEVGDQIFYKCLDDKGKECWAHTGYVVDIDGDDIYTIEGNWGCAVVERTVRLGEKYSGQWIGGFCRPSYDPDPAPEPEEPKKPTVVVDKEEWDRLNALLGTLGNENAKLTEANGILSIQLEENYVKLEKYQNVINHVIEAKKLLEELK